MTAPLLPLVLVVLARRVPGSPAPPSADARAARCCRSPSSAAPLAVARGRRPRAGVARRRRLRAAAGLGADAPGALRVADAARPDARRRSTSLPRAASADWALALARRSPPSAVVGLTWRLWSARAAVGVWGSYLALLLPVVGLLPSGLQVTADRYTYGPAMVLSVALARRAGRGAARRGSVASDWRCAALAIASSPAAVRAQLGHWRDSLTLWTRAADRSTPTTTWPATTWRWR